MSTEAERQRLLAFRVDGKARPKGSMIPVPTRKRNGALAVYFKPSSPDCELWARHVKAGARGAIGNLGGYAGEGGVTGFPTILPVRVSMVFGFIRPLRTTVEGNEHAPIAKTTAGDLDKLIRNVLDALTEAGVYRDDCQVTNVQATKCYVAPGEVAHTLIEVWEDF